MKEEQIVKTVRIGSANSKKLKMQLKIEKEAAVNNRALKFICSIKE